MQLPKIAEAVNGSIRTGFSISARGACFFNSETRRRRFTNPAHVIIMRRMHGAGTRE